MAAQYRTGFAPRNRALMGASSGMPTTWDSIARPPNQMPGSRSRPLMGTPGGGMPNPALAGMVGPAPGGIGMPQQRLPMVPPSTNTGAFALPPSQIPPMATPSPDNRPVVGPQARMGIGVQPRTRGPIP